MQKPQTIIDYISAFPKDIADQQSLSVALCCSANSQPTATNRKIKLVDYIQKVLEKIRQTIKKAAPKAEETISYGIPTFKLNHFLVHFAAYKNHIGFYPTSSGINAFKKEI